MKSYEEVTKSLLERREQYLANKKATRKKTIAIVVPVFCIVLVSLLVVGVFKGNNTGGIILPTDNKGEHQTDDNANPSNNPDDLINDKITKPNKGNKNNKNNKKPNANETEETLATDDYSGNANDYNGGKPTPNKDHNNNVGHSQNNTGDSTVNPDANKWINKIVVTQMPVKTVYYIGDTFDFRGLEVTGYFSTGEVEDITPYVQIYNERANYADSKYRIFIEYTDNSDSINLAFTEIFLTVLEPNIEISQTSLNLKVGESADISAITPATGCAVNWYSTDTSVVSVDNNGKITAVGSGSASVYAELSFYGAYEHVFQKQSSYCTVTVN